MIGRNHAPALKVNAERRRKNAGINASRVLLVACRMTIPGDESGGKKKARPCSAEKEYNAAERLMIPDAPRNYRAGRAHTRLSISIYVACFCRCTNFNVAVLHGGNGFHESQINLVSRISGGARVTN